MISFQEPNIMIIDNAKESSLLIKESLLKKWPSANIVCENLPYCSLMIMAIERPDILIVDYEFPNYCIIDEEVIIKRLLHFEGLVIIYSAHSPKDIKRCFINRFDHIPKNFRILSKDDPTSLRKEIIDFQSRKENGIKYPTSCD